MLTKTQIENIKAQLAQLRAGGNITSQSAKGPQVYETQKWIRIHTETLEFAALSCPQ